MSARLISLVLDKLRHNEVYHRFYGSKDTSAVSYESCLAYGESHMISEILNIIERYKSPPAVYQRTDILLQSAKWKVHLLAGRVKSLSVRGLQCGFQHNQHRGPSKLIP